MPVLRLSLPLLVLTLVLGSASRQASGQVYKWVDKKGTVHFTDNPDELPEPQRSEALRKLEEKLKKEQDKKKRQPSGPQPVRPDKLPSERLPPAPGKTPKPSGPDRSEQRRQKKKLWQSKVFKARSKVEEIEKKCRQIEADSQKSGRDALIFARPGDRHKSQKDTDALKECKKSLKQARYHLDVELPDQARRENVPPGWLR